MINRFGGAHDTAKHHIALLTHLIRRWALVRGEKLVQQGRLDQAGDVLELTTAELRELDDDANSPRQALADPRIQFYCKLETHVRRFPHVIDSRRRIPRPPTTPMASTDPHTLARIPISGGLHRGKVRLLHRPDASAVMSGDILVTYVTDPGWTPLFVRAGAIALEVGGPLQHGALMAREYGKPCVVGIENVTTKSQNGDLAELGGDARTVRVLTRAESR